MSSKTATAISCPNIAFIKYWGNRDNHLRIPSSGSISMNLDGLFSHTRVVFDDSFERDEFRLDGEVASENARLRVSDLLERVRSIAGFRAYARIESVNNFPTGTGIASSASGFAALALASSRAAGLELGEAELSRLARNSSGSACRSIPGGFVEWQPGKDDSDSYAFTIAPPDYWELRDCIAIISQEHKDTSSLIGHDLADTSLLQSARVIGASERLEKCRNAVLGRDFAALADIIEIDSNLMHAVMMTSTPRLLYWMPATIGVMKAVQEWRRLGLPVCYTIDAGPNVHVICLAESAQEVITRLNQLDGVEKVLLAAPGGPTKLVSEIPAAR